jgi:hypothetical protein
MFTTERSHAVTYKHVLWKVALCWLLDAPTPDTEVGMCKCSWLITQARWQEIALNDLYLWKSSDRKKLKGLDRTKQAYL